MFAALLCMVAALSTQSGQPSARDELAEYYRTSKQPASWGTSIRKLASSSAADRRNAAAHLVELMDQSWQDEQSGKAPWQATPYWGSAMENPARNLRGSIVGALEERPATPEILPIVQWVLRHEPQMPLQETAAGVLGKLDGKEADEHRRALVLQPHPNAIVMGKLLDQLRERKLAVPPDRLKDLCHHHRRVIRESSRKLNQALNGPDPGPFDPVQSLQSLPVRRILDELQTLLIELPAKDADFVEVTLRYLDKDEVKQIGKVRGWLVSEANDAVTVFSPDGTQRTYRDKEKTKIVLSKPIERGYEYSKIEVVTSVTVAKADVAAYAKEIADVRAKGNENLRCRRGGA